MGRIPRLFKEGWTRHKENAAKPLMERTGWLSNPRTQPPRLRPLRWLRDIFLVSAATPPWKGGEFVELEKTDKFKLPLPAHRSETRLSNDFGVDDWSVLFDCRLNLVRLSNQDED